MTETLTTTTTSNTSRITRMIRMGTEPAAPITQTHDAVWARETVRVENWEWYQCTALSQHA
ncbi:hypothetical protein E2C01_032019 [Portunus trituberculatus]|uniref:Uncharacterized protein n=1 Tax=Portunus trituberculatus TaxID=210409 RepID=A0A5B7F088_PORTR|nr:hypothetical protein [Portunus trituberculatus]